jgi:cytochrome c-type biogenesis protein CcmH/NrfG
MDKLIAEVKKIKFFIALGSIALVLSLLIGVVQIWLMYKSYKPYLEYKPSGYYKSEYQEFSNKAADLLAEAKYQELTNLATDQVAKRPTDPYGYFYLGLSYYYQGKYQEAIDSLNKVNQLEPSWQEKFTQSYIDKAQSMLKDKK